MCILYAMLHGAAHDLHKKYFMFSVDTTEALA